MEKLTTRQARRLALAKAGLLKPEWLGLPRRARGSGKQAREAAHKILEHFGYLQLDTVSIAGARSHALVLMSRLGGFDPRLGEELLRPGEPLFEYWGHEASWIPHSLYPAFEFRRRDFQQHPWWGDLIGQHPKVADRLRGRIRDEGALRSVDMEGSSSKGWWDLKISKRVATAMWSSGELAIRERHNFQRSFDLVERVIPDHLRSQPLTRSESFEILLLKALDGHGWATTGTLASTWRLRNCRDDLKSALERLQEKGKVLPCTLEIQALENRALKKAAGRTIQGWIQPTDLELAARLERIRPRKDRGVLLSPFDPVLWDRRRVELLFGFEQVLEIFKPAAQRVYGYFCLPVLAGEKLVARFDLKADRAQGQLQVLSRRYESSGNSTTVHSWEAEAAQSALETFQKSLGLQPRE
ncbi:MAG: winged helix DNA-binding domain-containing protein [Deltaproteobacteria bacterium]|nr:winged helix DNA-binding domain-containing protein [Deltaproteobacteria bacterium]